MFWPTDPHPAARRHEFARARAQRFWSRTERRIAEALKAYVKHAVDYAAAFETGRAASLKIEVVHSREAFRESLNETLAEYKLTPFDEDPADDVLACAMSLLQGVRLFDKATELGAFGLGAPWIGSPTWPRRSS